MGTDAEKDLDLIYERLTAGNGTFGDALVAIQEKHCCQRAGWNGKGMWIAYTPGSVIEAKAAPGKASIPPAYVGLRGAALRMAELEGEGTIRLCPHIDFRAADGSLVIGWLASQTDMLANDWRVLT